MQAIAASTAIAPLRRAALFAAAIGAVLAAPHFVENAPRISTAMGSLIEARAFEGTSDSFKPSVDAKARIEAGWEIERARAAAAMQPRRASPSREAGVVMIAAAQPAELR